jgi:glutathionyl-hydroquinone reductase
MADGLLQKELSDGSFKRQDSRFRDWIGVDERSGEMSSFEVEVGRYHLYLALACPWSHRAAIVRELTGLGEALGVSYLAPYRDERGWAFNGDAFEDGPGGQYIDRLHGWDFMAEAYEISDPGYGDRITVPVIWDTHSGRIVNNESSDIIRMMGSAESLGAFATNGDIGLYPEELRTEIDGLNRRIYDTINNGVYKAGFARRQKSYEHAFAELFESLEWLETLLGERRYLTGGRVTEADWRLFPTLALRRGLQPALPLQPPAGRRLPQSVGLRP